MKICSLLASGENEGKIWNLLKPAVVNFLPTSVPPDESFPTRRIHFQDAPTLLKVHFRWSPLPLPPHFLNVPFDPCSNSCSNIFQIVYFFFFLFDRNTTLCRFKRNTNPRLDDYSTRFRCIEQQFSNFEAISFRNNISGKERKFYSSTCLETDRIDSRHETVSIDQFSHGWIGLYVDVYRDNTRFVMQPTSFVPPIFFDFQFFLSQTLIKDSFFFEIEGKQIRGTIYFIIIKEFTKRGFSFFFLRIIILVFARLDRTLCQRIDRPEDRARCLPAECSLQFHQILWILLLSLTTKGSPDGKYRPRYSSINFLPFHFPLLCEKYAKSTY